MKWIIVVVLLLVVGSALYLRTTRARTGDRGTGRLHRLDDSVSRREPPADGDEP
jgi:hypothetical protein